MASEPHLAIRVLGPLSVTAADGSPIPMTARKHAELLAILAAERTACSPERVTELLWRGRPSASAASTLHGYVSRLRRSLAPTGVVRIDTVPAGYLLHCDGAVTDLDLLDQFGQEGLQLVRSDPRAGAEVLCRALELWRGEPLPEIADIADIAPELVRLAEIRAEFTETAADALRTVGEYRRSVALLTPLCQRHPYREGAARTLARALHDDGRTVDALGVLRRLRQALRDDLGLDPHPDTVALEDDLLDPSPAVSPLSATSATPQPVRELIGRVAEHAVLEKVWQTGADRPAGVVLIGPSGIGKTALVEHLIARHSAAARRFIGRPGPPGPTFGGLEELFGESPVSVPTARIVADLTARIWSDVAEHGRSVLLVDDAQWLDADSALVLGRVLAGIGQAPMTVLVTCRDPDAEPVEILRSTLNRHGPVAEVRLTELGSDDMRALIVRRLEQLGDTDRVDADALVAQSFGNPAVAQQLCAIARIGPPPDRDHPARSMYSTRFGDLSPGARALVTAVTIAGGDLPDDVFTEVARTLGQGVADEAVRSGLISPLRSELASVTKGLADIFSREQRIEAHARLAAAFEAVRPDDLESLAVHRVECAVDEDSTAVAARTCIGAAHRALSATADHRALDLARRGLGLPGLDSHSTVELRRIAGIAALRIGEFDSAADSFESAATVSRLTRDWPALAETALLSAPNGVAGYWSGYGVVQADHAALAREALTHGEALDPEVVARLHPSEADRLTVLGLPGADDHLGAARVVHDSGAVDFEIDLAEFLVRWVPDRLADRRKIARELYELSAGDLRRRATALHLQRVCALEAADLRLARRLSTEFTRLAGRIGGTDVETMQLWWQVMIALLRGDYDTSAALTERFAAMVGGLSDRARLLAESSMATSASIAAWHRGELASALPPFDALAEEVDEDFTLVIALGAAESGDLDRALELATELTADAGQWAGSRVVARVPLLIETLYAVSRDSCHRDAAGEICRRIEPFTADWSSGLVVQWPGLVCLGPATLYRGTAREVVGLDGTADLQDAVRVARDTEARPYVRRAEQRLLAG
ncbi:BTAD domain-containing putative transcriptional regulator [Gordonia terrae]|uniref:BTAD domain-containing putative transcriptional regulator n=1 Tax=Gordonia hongkongensis TaxID=1701090 RepID=UPI0022B5739D|nr:BTAD domain-containing putative transcriptional regulator [Gordonia terrae]